MLKTTKNALYVRSLGKITHFVYQPQRLKHAAQRPKNNANHSGLLEQKCLLRRKSAILSVRGKCHCIKKSFCRYSDRIWQYLVCPHILWARYRPKKKTGGLSRMHIGPKCVQILWNHQKKIPLLENYKEWALCAILRENNPFFLAATEAKTCCAMLCRGPKIMQIPRGYQKK